MSIIRITVFYFAKVRETVGINEEKIVLEKESTLNNLISKIEESHSSILKVKQDLQFAVNRKIVSRDLTLHEGDQIAVLPPVTGG